MFPSTHSILAPACATASYPGVTGKEHAMVLIGLIIIAVVLMALRVPGVPGIQRSCRRQCPLQARTGQRPDTEA